jgi:hypothetical protein
MTRSARFTPFLRAGVFGVGVLALGIPRATASDVPFGPRAVISDTALGAASVFAADIDGDGDLDVLSASYNDQRIAWYENRYVNGSAWILHTISATTNGAQAVSAVDVDGDGDLDVLSTSAVDHTIAWHENMKGNGSLWTVHTISTAADGGRSILAADVNGDGRPDVLTVSYSGDSVVWYDRTGDSNGPSTVWTAHTIATDAHGAISVFAADLDRDGDLDVLCASYGDDRVSWYENTAGDGSSWVFHTVSNGVSGAISVFASDVDRDGDLDVLSASFGDSMLTWYENTAGNGSAWTLHTISTAADGAVSLVAADLDGDGDRDVVAASFNGSAVAWYENVAGDGSVWTAHTLGTNVGGPLSVFSADLDGDGDLDVLSASELDDTVAWYRNQTIHSTACFVTPPPVSEGEDRPYSVFAADLDGDGDKDVLWGASLTTDLAWDENVAGDGSVWALHLISTSPNSAESVVAADVDGDGDLDALSAEIGVAWYENTAANGSAWTLHTITTAPHYSHSIAAADVDGDGDLDVLCASTFDDTIAWHENNAGNGSSWTAHTITTGADMAYSVVAADIDGDGDIDAVSASQNDGKVAWYENVVGDGSVWTTHTIALAGAFINSVFAIDVDGDGDVDCLSSNFFAGVFWYENVRGDGSIWKTHTISVTLTATTVIAGDLDGDGDVDALATFYVYDAAVWYENTSRKGLTWTPHTITTTAARPLAAFAADLTGDGQVDVLSASIFDDKVAWYQNQSGQFLLDVTDLVPPIVHSGDLVPVLRVDVKHAGRKGDSALELASLGLLFEESPGDPLTSAQANALVDELRIYRDANGNGVFEPAIDSLVTTVPDLSLISGIQAVPFADGDPGVEVGAPRKATFFIAAQIAPGAGSQVPNQFRITHLGTGPSATVAEDRSADIPLRLGCPADVSSSTVGPILLVRTQRRGDE